MVVGAPAVLEQVPISARKGVNELLWAQSAPSLAAPGEGQLPKREESSPGRGPSGESRVKAQLSLNP